MGARISAVYCEHCGYDLTGQPRAGRCPECGAEYDVDRPGTSQHLSGQERRRRRWRTIALAVLAAMALVCGGGLQLARNALSPAPTRPWGLLCLGGVAAFVLGLAALTSYVYEREP